MLNLLGNWHEATIKNYLTYYLAYPKRHVLEARLLPKYFPFLMSFGNERGLNLVRVVGFCKKKTR